MTNDRSRFSRFVERARSEPGLGRNILTFVGLAVIGAVACGYFLVNQRFNPPWEDRYSLNATFSEAPGVSPGNGQEVRIAGVEVGDIRSSDVTGRGQAQLEMRIENDQLVYDNAKVVLRPKSPLNDMYIEISPGGPPGKPLKDGDTISVENTVNPVQIDEALGHLDNDVQRAVTALLSESDVALANAPTELPKGLDATQQTLDELQPVVEQLDLRRENLARLVTALGQISAATGDNDERLTRLADSLQRTLSTLGARDDSLDAALAELPDFTAELERASTGVDTLVGQLDPTLDNLDAASDELPDALDRLNDSVPELDSFLDRAAPVLETAKPVVDDLATASPDLVKTTGDLRPLTQSLKPLTETAVPYLDSLNAFFYNTNSVVSLRDANRGILRGSLGLSPESIPDDILQQLLDLNLDGDR